VAIHSAEPAAAPIYDRIRRKNPTMKLSQMSDASVARMALPVGVEIGEPGKSYNEASIQLGVWCCAGLVKLEELQQQNGKDPASKPIPLIELN
jgi:hypothetical protein